MRRALVGLTILAAAWLVAPRRAAADFRMCNDTRVRLEVVFGFKQKSEGWVARGWWRIDPGGCKSLSRGPLEKRYFYFHATGGRAHPEVTYSGKAHFCVEMKKFTAYQSEYGKRTEADCSAAGLVRAGFVKVDTQGEKNYTYRLNEKKTPIAGAGPTPSPASDRPPPADGGGGSGGGAKRGGGNGGGGGKGGSACQRFPNLC